MGNRSVNFWLTALSAHASDMSAWLFMAFPAAIYIGGLANAWTGVGLFIGMWLNWQFVAKKLRTETEKYKSYTLSTFFENRFHDKSGTLRIFTALMALIFLTSYLSAGLIAMGLLFESIFGIDYTFGVTVASAVVMIYTFYGGFVTVAWTDLFQALFLLTMIALVPFVAFYSLPDGWQTIVENAKSENISLGFIGSSWNSESFLSTIFLIFGWGLGYFGQPHILTKFMGINDPDEMVKSKYVGMTWQFFALSAAIIVGIVGIGFFNETLANPELVFVEMVKSSFTPFFAGFILCAILAANMSTMDSQVLVCGSILSEDFYKHLFHREASSANLLYASRIGVILVSLLSLVIALAQNSTVLEVVLYAWSGLGCSFGPLVLMSLYYPKTSRLGALAGIVVGGTVAGTWHLWGPSLTDLAVPAMIPGFILSLLSIYLVSLITYRVNSFQEGSTTYSELR